MIKYYAGCRSISLVEISRETESCVFQIVSRLGKDRTVRYLRRSSDNGYFDTWEDANQFMIDNAQKDVDKARSSLEYYKSILGNIKGMKK